LAKRSISKGVIKDIAIVVIAVIVIWIGLQAAFGTQNPFYVVASGSMIPALEVYDIIVIQGHEPFEEVQVGDIIVFDRPSDHNRVIVHRVESILSEDPLQLEHKVMQIPHSSEEQIIQLQKRNILEKLHMSFHKSDTLHKS